MRRGIPALMIALLAATSACGGGNSGTTGATAPTDQPAPTPTAASAPQTRPSALPRGSQPVHLDPAQFTSRIDNPWWPMTPGSRWVYRETDAQGQQQRVEITVTRQTKKILGIDTRVVHDVATLNGQVQEDTLDWYAQDAQGNVWYMGEDTKEYENGKVISTQGTWQAGVDGAQPGILLPGHPSPGLRYRQEYYKGEAEDAAMVLSLDMRAKVPFGVYDHLLTTKESTRLEPDVLEHKFYARGVGPVLAITVSGGSSRQELIGFERSS